MRTRVVELVAPCPAGRADGRAGQLAEVDAVADAKYAMAHAEGLPGHAQPRPKLLRSSERRWWRPPLRRPRPAPRWAAAEAAELVLEAQARVDGQSLGCPPVVLKEPAQSWCGSSSRLAEALRVGAEAEVMGLRWDSDWQGIGPFGHPPFGFTSR